MTASGSGVIDQYPDVWQYEGVAYYVYPREDRSAVQIIKGPALQWITPDSVTILWETDVPAGTSVDYGMGAGDRHSISDPAPVTLHRVVLSGLAPDALYSYTATSGPASKIGAFTSMPQAGQPFRFAVYGDSRTYPDAHAQVAESIRVNRPGIVFHTGDLVTAGRDFATWKEFFEPAAGLMANAPVIPVPGNHEYAGSGPLWFFYLFDRPHHEGWFALTYGDIRFIGLDTSAPFTAGSPQHNWLSQELASDASRNAIWRVVILHEPPFTSAVGREDNPVVRSELVPLFEQCESGRGLLRTQPRLRAIPAQRYLLHRHRRRRRAAVHAGAGHDAAHSRSSACPSTTIASRMSTLTRSRSQPWTPPAESSTR